jgi:hypothetical protein
VRRILLSREAIEREREGKGFSWEILILVSSGMAGQNYYFFRRKRVDHCNLKSNLNNIGKDFTSRRKRRNMT